MKNAFFLWLPKNSSKKGRINAKRAIKRRSHVPKPNLGIRTNQRVNQSIPQKITNNEGWVIIYYIQSEKIKTFVTGREDP